MKLIAVCIATTLSIALPTSARPVGCTGFSTERADTDARIHWSYRICTTDTSSEVHVRFRNALNRAQHVRYRIWTTRVRGCLFTPPPAATGTVALAPHTTTSWPYTSVPAKPHTRAISICLDALQP